MRLRDYQDTLISDLYSEINNGYRRIAIIAGTGAGKTIVSAKICSDAVTANKKILFLVHLDVLVGQTYEKMKAFNLPCGFIKAGWDENRDAPVQIASIQTMANRDWWVNYNPDIIIYDEGHITFFSEIGKSVFNLFPNAVHLPMTATPKRLGKEQLGDYMETFVSSPIPLELQSRGYLSPLKYYSFPGNTLECAAKYTEFEAHQLKVSCDTPELISAIIDEWKRLTPGKRTIAFCVDTEHAENVAAEFRANGIPSCAVTGSTPKNLRKQMYDALASGELLVLTSCNVISIGFDEPSVEVGLLLRPTMSSALHFQQLGRVMRISPETGKQCGIILDQANNLNRLGYPEDIRKYVLPVCEKPYTGETPAPTKECPHCMKEVYCFTTVCPTCEYVWNRADEIPDGEMIQVEGRSISLVRLFQSHRRQAYIDNRPPETASELFYKQTDHNPEEFWCLGSIYGPNPNKSQRYSILKYLIGFNKSRNWVISEYEKEVGPKTFNQLINAN